MSLPLPQISDDEFQIHPLERAETISSSWYTDPRFHGLDKQAIFNSSWHGVGHVSRLKNIGDYIVATVAENPSIVVKGQDEKLHAFYNVCKHRGGPIAMEDGCAKVLQCKYHGWTYLLDGSLRGTPKFDRTELFDKKDFGRQFLSPQRNSTSVSRTKFDAIGKCMWTIISKVITCRSSIPSCAISSTSNSM
jgi:choline monooxygenase